MSNSDKETTLVDAVLAVVDTEKIFESIKIFPTALAVHFIELNLFAMIIFLILTFMICRRY